MANAFLYEPLYDFERLLREAFAPQYVERASHHHNDAVVRSIKPRQVTRVVLCIEHSNNFEFQVGPPREHREEPRNRLLGFTRCFKGGYPNRRRQRQTHRFGGEEGVDGTLRGWVRHARTTIWEIIEDYSTTPGD